MLYSSAVTVMSARDKTYASVLCELCSMAEIPWQSDIMFRSAI